VNKSDDVSSRFLASLIRLQPVRIRNVPHRRLVYHAILPGKTYIVQKGYVRLRTVGEGGEQRTRMLLGKGGMFGDLPFTPPSVMKEESAMTSGPTSIFEFQRKTLEVAAHHDPIVSQLLLEVYSRQLGLLERRLQWQFATPLRRRVAMILLDLMEFGRSPCPHYEGVLVDIRITHEELAELAGATRQVVTAILNVLRAEGILRYTRTYLCVRSTTDLAQVIQSSKT